MGGPALLLGKPGVLPWAVHRWEWLVAGGAGAVPQPAMAPRLFMCLGPGCRLGHPLRLFLHPGFGVTVWGTFFGTFSVINRLV